MFFFLFFFFFNFRSSSLSPGVRLPVLRLSVAGTGCVCGCVGAMSRWLGTDRPAKLEGSAVAGATFDISRGLLTRTQRGRSIAVLSVFVLRQLAVSATF